VADKVETALLRHQRLPDEDYSWHCSVEIRARMAETGEPYNVARRNIEDRQ
jgi:hypothetical protein